MRCPLIALSLSCAAVSACATTDESPPPTDEPALAEYVRTPSAWVHRDCVIEVESGADVQDDGTIVHTDGRVEYVAPCAHPAVWVRHEAALAGPVPAELPTVNGWIESADWHPWAGVGAMAANWTVPASPVWNQGQLLYLFPGMEPLYSNPAKIVQPVLQWGVSPAGGGAWWGLASWVVWQSGTAIHSPLIGTAPGHSIRGVMAGTSCSTNVCSTWDINSYDQSTGRSTTLHHTGNGYSFQWVTGGAFEGYGVQSCNDFPNSYEPFTSVHVRSTAGTLMAPSWNRNIYQPGCRESIWTDTYTVHLHFNS